MGLGPRVNLDVYESGHELGSPVGQGPGCGPHTSVAITLKGTWRGACACDKLSAQQPTRSEMGAPRNMGRAGVGCRGDPAALGSGGGHSGTSSLSTVLGKDRLLQECWLRSRQLQRPGRAVVHGPAGRWPGRVLRAGPHGRGLGPPRLCQTLPGGPVLGRGPGRTSPGCV